MQKAPGGGEAQRPGTGGGLEKAPGGGAGGTQEPRAGQSMDKQPGPSGTTRQEQIQRGERQPDGKDGDRRAGEKQRTQEGREQTKDRPDGAEKRGAGGGVGVRPDLSRESRATIRRHLSGGPRVSNLNVSIAVGSRLPRNVEVRPLPQAVIEIVPQYRGYYYVLVGDQIVIVDRDTLEIVAVLEA